MKGLVFFTFCIISPDIVIAFDNKCLYERQILNRKGPRTFNCAKFVVDSTDEIWNSNRTSQWIDSKLEKYMTRDWQSVSSYGLYLSGMKELKQLLSDFLGAFPDLRLHITDVFCEGNDIDGYKTTMASVHTATHLGKSRLFGPPTGKAVKWQGIANCFIKNFNGQYKYTAEWNMPDMWALYEQLGVKPAHPAHNPQPVADCEQIFDWDTGRLNKKLVPRYTP